MISELFKNLFSLGRIFSNSAKEKSRDLTLPKGTFCNTVIIKNAEGDEGKKKKYIPVGVFPVHPDGPHEITTEKLEEMVANQGGDWMVDLGHESIWNGGAPAYGWIELESLEVREDGLYGNAPKYTAKAAEMVENDEYRYLSPAYMLETSDKKTGKDKGARLLAIALTNTPYMEEIDDARLNTDKNEDKMEYTKEFKKKIGLAEDATDAEVEAKIEELLKAKEDEGTEESEVTEETEKKEAEAATNSAIESRLKKLEDERKADAETAKKNSAAHLVDSAIVAFKIKPSERDIYLNSALHDFDKTKTALDALKADSVRPGRVATPTTEGDKGTVKKNSQADVAAWMKEQGRVRAA